jgi:hypothetical protein
MEKNNFIKGRGRKDQSVAGTQAGNLMSLSSWCVETQWPDCAEFDICLQSFRHKKVLLTKGVPGEGTVLRQQWVGSLAWALSHYPLWEWVVCWGKHVILSLGK